MQVRNNDTVTSHHVSVLIGDNILRQFGKLEKMVANSTPSLEEHPVLEHFPNCTTEMVHESQTLSPSSLLILVVWEISICKLSISWSRIMKEYFIMIKSYKQPLLVLCRGFCTIVLRLLKYCILWLKACYCTIIVARRHKNTLEIWYDTEIRT